MPTGIRNQFAAGAIPSLRRARRGGVRIPPIKPMPTEKAQESAFENLAAGTRSRRSVGADLRSARGGGANRAFRSNAVRGAGMGRPEVGPYGGDISRPRNGSLQMRLRCEITGPDRQGPPPRPRSARCGACEEDMVFFAYKGKLCHLMSEEMPCSLPQTVIPGRVANRGPSGTPRGSAGERHLLRGKDCRADARR